MYLINQKILFDLKKFIHIFIAILWLSASTGFSITKHYCGGKYVNMSFNSTPESCCENSDCCRNESEAYQLDEDTVIQHDVIINQAISFDIMVFENPFFELENPKSIESVFFDGNHIPPPDLPDILASFQSFLL